MEQINDVARSEDKDKYFDIIDNGEKIGEFKIIIGDNGKALNDFLRSAYFNKVLDQLQA